MTKREFLDRLERCLASLDAGERAGMVDFYSEQIDDRIDDGMTEEQAVASLESPEDIAANILSLREEAVAQPATPPASPASEPKGCLHTAGKVALWICAAIGIIIVLPIAVCLASAVLCVYLSFWCVVVGLGASALACVVSALFNIVACFMTPAAAPALVADLAFSAGLLGIAIVLGLGTFFLAKLLVMLVVWTVRAIQNRGARRRSSTAPVAPAKEYASMPLPPMATEASRRKSLPAWAVLLITGVVVIVAAGCTAFGAMVAAGGPEQLAALAHPRNDEPILTAKGFSVDTIDLTINEQRSGRTPSITVSTSPDENIYVYDNDLLVGGTLFWGDAVRVQPSCTGSTLELGATTTHVFAMQTFLGALATETHPDAGRVRIQVPQGWEGTIVCSNAVSNLYIGNIADGPIEPLRIDGSIVIERAEYVALSQLACDAITVDARNVWASELDVNTLAVNEDLTNGHARLYNINAKRLSVGGAFAELSGVEATTFEASTRTELWGPDVEDDNQAA